MTHILKNLIKASAFSATLLVSNFAFAFLPGPWRTTTGPVADGPVAAGDATSAQISVKENVINFGRSSVYCSDQNSISFIVNEIKLFENPNAEQLEIGQIRIYDTSGRGELFIQSGCIISLHYEPGNR